MCSRMSFYSIYFPSLTRGPSKDRNYERTKVSNQVQPKQAQAKASSDTCACANPVSVSPSDGCDAMRHSARRLRFVTEAQLRVGDHIAWHTHQGHERPTTQIHAAVAATTGFDASPILQLRWFAVTAIRRHLAHRANEQPRYKTIHGSVFAQAIVSHGTVVCAIQHAFTHPRAHSY